MSILLLFSSTEIGGAEKSLTRMAVASAPSEYQLGTLSGDGPWCDWVRSQGREPLVFGRRNHSGQVRINIFTILKLIRHVRLKKIQIIYICGARASLWLRLLKPLMNDVKLVYGVRWNPNSNSRLDIFFRVLERYLGGFVNMYIANSQIAADTLVERCGVLPAKIFVIYNGISEFQSHILPLVNRPLNVLTVANLNPRKGYLEYLSCIEMVLQTIPNANFIFVGRDDMNGKVQSAINERGLSNRVSWIGYQKDIPSIMRSARVLVVPSLWNEGCPTSVLEAMSLGVPVVGYKMDGLPELVRHGQDGLLVPIADIKSLATAIIKVLTDLEFASRLANSSLMRIQLDFQLLNCVIKHRDALNLLRKDHSLEKY